MGLISFLGFTILVAVIAWYSTRSTNEDSSDGYFLGGRSLTATVIAGSLLLTNLSTEQIVGLNGQAFSEGILVMAWETLAAIAMVVTAVFLLPRYLKGGLTTVPQFLEKRYDTMTKTITSGLFLSGYVVVLLPIVLYSGALAFSAMFDIPELLAELRGMPMVTEEDIAAAKTFSLWVCVWGIGIIGSIYAVFGGLKAVAVSDTINAVGLLIGGIMIPFFGLAFIGDGSIGEGFSILMAENTDKFESIGGATDSVPFATIFTGMMLVQLFYWGTNQAIIQRALAAKNLEEGQKGLMLAAFFKILGPLIVVLPGVIAWHIFKGDASMVADEAYPMLVKKVLPASLVGFFAAVLFGAILSSFNSALNSSVTLFGIDIYKQYINKNASERQIVKAGKTFGVGLAILAMFIAPMIANAPDGLFGYLQEVNGCYSIPIFTIIVVGYLTKRVPARAAKIAIVLGVVLYSISQFMLKPAYVNDAVEKVLITKIEEIKTSSPDPAMKAMALKLEELKGYEVPLWKLEELATTEFPIIKKEPHTKTAFDIARIEAYPHFLHVMAILFIMNVLIMLAIGKVYPRKSDFTLEYTKQVDITPWKIVYPIGGAIIAIVIAIYIYFT